MRLGEGRRRNFWIERIIDVLNPTQCPVEEASLVLVGQHSRDESGREGGLVSDKGERAGMAPGKDFGPLTGFGPVALKLTCTVCTAEATKFEIYLTDGNHIYKNL